MLWLADASIDSPDSGIVRIAIGIRESLRGNTDNAVKQFRIAREAFPKTGRLINELADYMLKSNTLPQEKLLNLLNIAIDNSPEETHLLRTRATLQMGLKSLLTSL